MEKLPKDLYDDLIYAAENAKYPRTCSYDVGIAKERERRLKEENEQVEEVSSIPKRFKTNEPCCVIAQLYVKRGGNLDNLKEGFGVYSPKLGADLSVLKEYPMHLLSEIQMKWDGTMGDPISTNEELVAFVNTVAECENA